MSDNALIAIIVLLCMASCNISKVVEMKAAASKYESDQQTIRELGKRL